MLAEDIERNSALCSPSGSQLGGAPVDPGRFDELSLQARRYIANLFGQDKLSLKERFDWVFENEATILDAAANPLDGDRFWTTADEPWQALAACHDWLGYYTFGPDYESRTPVALDGANSGLQHFSALLRDPIGARAVNLIPGERPQDIYAEVAVKAQGSADAAEDPSGKLWANGRLTRRIAKRPCMTFVYSATASPSRTRPSRPWAVAMSSRSSRSVSSSARTTRTTHPLASGS